MACLTNSGVVPVVACFLRENILVCFMKYAAIYDNASHDSFCRLSYGFSQKLMVDRIAELNLR